MDDLSDFTNVYPDNAPSNSSDNSTYADYASGSTENIGVGAVNFSTVIESAIAITGLLCVLVFICVIIGCFCSQRNKRHSVIIKEITDQKQCTYQILDDADAEDHTNCPESRCMSQDQSHHNYGTYEAKYTLQYKYSL
eukprot:56613_1